ncbi:MAG: SMC-Scp complex subunit ScpB [Oscillospiraceae bacterium]|nr:SMC-Scp complex subunit ScpB [Oscillospiraceae bacterium]
MTDNLKSAIEAVLFAAGDSVPVSKLSLVFACEEEKILEAAEALETEYIAQDRGMRLLRLGDRLQICSSPEWADVIIRALDERRRPSLSQPALEVLTIVAYFQPVTRAYIETMRGIDSSYTIGALMEKGLIEISGRLEAPGRPALFRTTEAFLRVMGISSPQELPPLPDLKTSDGTEKLRQRVEELQAAENSDQITMSELV